MRKKGSVKFSHKQNPAFYPTLRKRVEKYFTDNKISPHANATMVIKTIVLVSGYLLPFVLMLFVEVPVWLALSLWLLMGISMAGIGMSVMHDALHGAYSKNGKVNVFVGSVLNLLGGSAFNWKLQHNVLHHTYTNVYRMDDDIDQKLILRFTDHAPPMKVHRFQWIYAVFFYGILTLYWVTAKDFIQFVKYTKNGVNPGTPKQNRLVLTRMILQKLIYFYIIMVLPITVFGLAPAVVIGGFFIMHFAAGIILTVTFQLAHSVEGTTHPLPDENGIIHQNWAVHQMESTVNFSTNNKFLTWYMGGLNFQVEHHLFPKISHVHYPKIAPIVKATAEEFGIPYLVNEKLSDAIRSHINLLQSLGKLPDINEALA